MDSSEFKYKNKDLYDALLAYTLKALSTLKEAKAESRVQMTRETSWENSGGDFFVSSVVDRPLWVFAYIEYEDMLLNLQEYKSAENIIRLDPKLSSQVDTLVGTYKQRVRFETKGLINAICLKLINQTNAFTFNKDAFNAEYLYLEELLYSDYLYEKRITPLYGFKLLDTALNLDDNIEVISLSNDDITNLLNEGFRLGIQQGNKVQHAVSRNAIRIRHKLPKVIGPSQEHSNDVEIQDPFRGGEWEQRIIDALRVFKHGPVYPITTICFHETFASRGYSYSLGQISPINISGKYELNNDEANEFTKFWKRISNEQVLRRSFLTVALQRFSQAVARVKDEDKIIDLMICAEALFLSQLGKVEGEKRYRLALRAAFFIEQDTARRISIFRLMRNAYDIRSQIVHGTNKPLEMPKKGDGAQYSLKEFCNEIEEYLRKALHKAIELAQDSRAPNYLIDWDSLIFQAQ